MPSGLCKHAGNLTKWKPYENLDPDKRSEPTNEPQAYAGLATREIKITKQPGGLCDYADPHDAYLRPIESNAWGWIEKKNIYRITSTFELTWLKSQGGAERFL